LGLTLGTPNLFGLNIEYVTQAFNGKLAPSIDISSIKIKDGEVDVRFSYVELGGNYYFNQKSKGFFAQLSYGRIGFIGNYNDPIYGSGEGKLGFNLINVKFGAKWGNRFYLRPEIGFANPFGDAVVKVEYTEPITNLTIIVEEEIPSFLSGGLVYNLGIGFAF
tara:strand:+ start:792 stop:1280 length:489 start_codon:yes stop_codon:yes gene_type:complete